MIVDGKRALAYIATITDVQPIESYDRVVYIQINNGWWCVSSKNDNFKIGDKCVYFEIDSLVPKDDERFAFLEKRKYRIKTQKLCKVLSQGLAMPVSLFDEVKDKEVGEDVTDILRVKYYELEDNYRKNKTGDPNAKYRSMASRHPKLAKKKWWKWLMKREWGKWLLFKIFGKKKDNPRKFPSHFEFIKKTDEERCLFRDEKIMTDKGLIRIADIVNKKLDVKVLSYNEVSGELEYKSIVDYQKFPSDKELLQIKFPYKYGALKNNTLTCTKDHKLYTDRGYITAENLSLDDKVYLAVETFDDEMVEYLYGHVLGDGHLIIGSTDKYALSFCQGEKHKKYLETLHRMYDGRPIRIERSGYKPENKIYKFGFHHLDILSYYLNEDKTIVDGKFKVTKEFCDRLTEKSIATWYMDDGACHIDKEGNLGGRALFASAAFSEEENKLLADCLCNKFEIDCKVVFDGRYYGILAVDREATIKLFNLIGKYFTEDMQYKLPKSLRTDKSILDDVQFKLKYKLLPVKVESINLLTNTNKNGKACVYDIEVEDNHNFFARGILNHNCENMPWILKDKCPWLVTEKLDGTSSTYILERKGKNKFEFYVCSRNIRQKDENQECYHDTNIYWDMAFKYDIENKLKDYLMDYPDLKYVCIQGESVGNVQGNPLKLEEDDLYIFNFIRSDEGRLDSVTGSNIIKSWGMKWVPILSTNYILPDDLEEFKKVADGNSIVNPEVLREGIVLRDPKTNRSFKSVSRKYLLNHQ